MKHIFAIIFTFSVLTLISCNNDDKSQDYDKSIMPEGYTNNQVDTGIGNAALQGSNTNNPALNGGMVPGNLQMPVVNQSASANAAPQIIQQGQPMVVNKTSNSSSGLNPAHGAPGHRCDISVGAPLNSAPSTTVTQPQSQPQPQTITTTSNATVKTATAPGMNPAHGEPGHRCDISVGAPLNSKPAEVKTTAPQSTPTLTPIVPANKETAVPASGQ